MRKLILILLVSLAANGVAQIRIAQPSQELGDVFENKGIVKTTFNLFNPYLEDTIQIVNINTSCGCTAVLSDERIILPRQTLELVVAYDPTNRPGLFMKTVEVETVTGKNERNSLYLKISGNVIVENVLVKDVNADLREYKVSPISYYAMTSFDTSYLDFGFFETFINDLTFEVDYYQFSTVGLIIEVDNYDRIEELENLVRFSRRRIVRGFIERGFNPNTVIFIDPVFKEAELPVWATAKIKAYSYNFNDERVAESVIKVSEDEHLADEKLLLNYTRYRLPDIDDIMSEINFKRIESKLFVNNSLRLKGAVQISTTTAKNKAEKLMKKLEGAIFKRVKKTTGVTADHFIVEIDSISPHPKNKIRFMLWDVLDEEDQTVLTYVPRKDKIEPPKLPTYKQSTTMQSTVDMATRDFRRMWKSLLLNHRAGHSCKMVIEASTSQKPDPLTNEDKNTYVRRIALEAKQFIIARFEEATGRKLEVEIIPLVHGPAYEGDFKKHADFKQYEYLNFIPLVHTNVENPEPNPNPYQVNFDYYFNGIDTTSLVFNNFARYIARTVERDGFVELRIESSISRIPIERNRTNIFLAYQRSMESQNRLREQLGRKLVDPNRIIFSEERNLQQGPEYDRKTPIVKFRKYHYLRIVPDKMLRKNG